MKAKLDPCREVTQAKWFDEFSLDNRESSWEVATRLIRSRVAEAASADTVTKVKHDEAVRELSRIIASIFSPASPSLSESVYSELCKKYEVKP